MRVLAEPSLQERVVLIGLESSGKSTLFSRLSGFDVGDETNVKGSTYSIKKSHFHHRVLIDTPGLRMNDTQTNKMAICEIEKSTSIILVIRGTHFHEELRELLPLVEGKNKHVLIVTTFVDKMNELSKTALAKYILKHKLPLFVWDARNMDSTQESLLIESLDEQKVIKKQQYEALLAIRLEQIEPQPLLFDQPRIGPVLSIVSLVMIFLLPVVMAYNVSDKIQPIIDKYVITRFVSLFENGIPFITSIFIGDYGLLTLGIYSFVWAFPVVLFIGISIAIADETGLKDRIVDTLDPILKKIGMNGRDLIPILSGFGCNVVAVFQSRTCSTCTRKQCVSFISFGSACSYQIGATLSIFNSAHKPWMFLPYVLMLVIGGVIHTRLWYRNQLQENPFPLKIRRTFLQKPTFSGTMFRIKGDLKQFCTQALPIFIFICVISTVLHEMNLIQFLSVLFYPLLFLLDLPIEAAAGLAFSIIRKDGILVFNEGNGALLEGLSNPQLFLLIFLASTLTACVVTMMTIRKEMGFKLMAQFIYRQISTSTALTLILVLFFRLTNFY